MRSTRPDDFGRVAKTMAAKDSSHSVRACVQLTIPAKMTIPSFGPRAPESFRYSCSSRLGVTCHPSSPCAARLGFHPSPGTASLAGTTPHTHLREPTTSLRTGPDSPHHRVGNRMRISLRNQDRIRQLIGRDQGGDCPSSESSRLSMPAVASESVFDRPTVNASALLMRTYRHACGQGESGLSSVGRKQSVYSVPCLLKNISERKHLCLALE
jgi:hypothetical protein